MTSVRQTLATLGESIRGHFSGTRRMVSYAEYLDLVMNEPARQLRSSPQYILDCFHHFGSEPVRYPWGDARRWKLFDCDWAAGEGRLIGQEVAQNQVYRALAGFVRDGAPTRLVLLHGPNGSAKSTLIRCIGRALEHYSTLDEGALYKFSWVFPAQRQTRGGIGFGGAAAGETGAAETFAYLPDDLVDARLQDELHDHPLLLIPAERRAEVLGSALEKLGGAQILPDYLRLGQLSAKNRAVYEALLASYHGDYVKVLRHVAVERFYISHRYRTGYVTVEPQMSVDASERQVTADRSLAALPPSLQSVALYEYGGELVGANRGMIEFDDLLKRPLEAYKYLLVTVERGAVALSSANLFLDLVFVGSTNEVHLSAFKEIPDFASFKGRLELVRVPYILDVRHEQTLYADKLREAAGGRHVAPHTAYVAALWAVLTRMRKPQVDRYPGPLAEVVGKLGPLEKAELYASGVLPPGVTPAQGKELVAHIKDLWTESETYPNYEGRIGASPRELHGVLLNAAASTKYPYVSPLAVLDELGELSRQGSLYEFLRQDVQPGGFHDHKRFIDLVRERMISRIDDEVRASLGMIEESEYLRVFERYVAHVTHALRKEKIRNPSTGRMEDPDEGMMREVEKTLEAPGKPEDYRASLIARIGAWSLDHRGEKPVLSEIFADQLKRLRDAYFERHRKAIGHGVTELVQFLTADGAGLAPDAVVRAERALGVLVDRFGYQRESARDLVALMARVRYR
ncbi:MAG: serine protein kinase PrkA [Kofleriaceae bacterium]|nr:MAG: serine protein kinase PrkA [Kofleriaceae bacterium]MBZ0230964.1 serine protein kinase PrkA [Kofleriaceae bacterium]